MTAKPSKPTRPFTIDPRAPKGEYHIEFATQAPGYLTAVKITIEVDQLPNDTGSPQAMQEKYRVDLCDHPLYKKLERYVRANPSSRR